MIKKRSYSEREGKKMYDKKSYLVEEEVEKK